MENREDVRIGFTGIGQAGRALALALAERGYRVAGVHSRRADSSEGLAMQIGGCRAYGQVQELCDEVDLVFITTPDRAISQVAESVAWRPGQGAAHCCGAASVELLAAAADQGAVTGAFHPCQTLAGVTDSAKAIQRLKGAAFAVAGNGWLPDFLGQLARDLGGTPVQVPDGQRALYHAASVMSCGFLVALLKDAVSIWEGMGIGREQAVSALGLLARAALDNAAGIGLEAAATGPVMRADAVTVEAHLKALVRSHPEVASVYATLARSSLSIAESRGLQPAELQGMRDLLGGHYPQPAPTQD